MEEKRKGNRAKREKLFSEYSYNLSFYKPELIDQFLCPVCENAITKADLEKEPFKVVLAHIIPKSMGYRLYSLACKECDNRIGRLFDKHLSDEMKSIANSTEQKGIHGSLRGKRTYGAMFIPYSSKNNNGFKVMPLPNFPQSIWNGMLREFIELKKVGVKVKFNRSFDTNRRNISHIYSAFLLMFSTYGYEYVLSSNVDSIQNIFIDDVDNNPPKKIHKLVFDIPSTAVAKQTPSISIITEPKEIHAFFITLPSPRKNRSRCVFLPGFGKPGEIGYKNLLDLIETQLDIELELSTLNPLDGYKSHLKNIEFKGIGKFMWDSVIAMTEHPETKDIYHNNFRFSYE